jgi:hypothetical protein
MQAKLRSTVAAMMLLAPVAATLIAQPVQAQTRATVAQPAVTNMALNSDSGLSAGATLRVQLYATPNASRASVSLGDSGITVPLRQQGPGNYTGSYVVRRTDRIDPMQLITARVVFGDRTYSRQFNYPAAFQALAMGAPPSSVAIERFVMRPMGRIEPGRELRYRLIGTPGADAWLDIPGVIRGVDLVEVRPGVYEGTYTVRRRDDANAFSRAVATLRNGNQRTTARVDLRGGDREFGQAPPPPGQDARPPQISDMTPANGERVGDRGRTLVSARLQDEGTGIDRDSVRLRIDGREVSDDVRVSADDVRYRAELPPGRHTAELTVRDRAGNTTTKAWTFDVVPGDRMGAAGPGPLPLAITSHRDNAIVDAAGNLAIQGRTAPFANVRIHVESVASVAGVLGVTQPVADQTVQADRNGNFAVTITPRGLPIPGTRYDVRLTATSGNQSAEERLTLYQRQG